MWATVCNAVSVKGNILKPFAGEDVCSASGWRPGTQLFDLCSRAGAWIPRQVARPAASADHQITAHEMDISSINRWTFYYWDREPLHGISLPWRGLLCQSKCPGMGSNEAESRERATAGFMELWRAALVRWLVAGGRAGECGNWLHKSISAQNIPPHSGLQSLQYRGQLKVTSPPPCRQCRISAGV